MSDAPSGDATTTSTLITVHWRAWRIFGMVCGPSRSAVVRVSLVAGAPPIIERVDRMPLGNIREQCHKVIEQTLAGLRERARSQRATSRQLAERNARATASTPPDEAIEARTDGAPESSPDKIASSVFRIDRQGITDRIEKAKRESRLQFAPVPVEDAEPTKAEPAKDSRTSAIARLEELRAQAAAARRRADDAVMPFDDVPSDPVADRPVEGAGRTSSVFRVEREAITDRIARLKRTSGSGTGSGSDAKLRPPTNMWKDGDGSGT